MYVRSRGRRTISVCIRKFIFTGIAITVCLGLFSHDRENNQKRIRNYRSNIRHILEASQNSDNDSSTSNENHRKTAVPNEIKSSAPDKTPERKQLSVTETTTVTETAIENATKIEEEEEFCTPPAYHEFPPDLFNNYQRSHGAIVVHILVVFYMFYAVAVVCDDYFIASLEECCARLDMSEDVAGATFMAAGSSAPELFTAILGVLVAKGDVGTGTIVGSAVFNVLFVIGLCGIFSGREVTLSWWPITRDSVFYSFTVVVLIIIIYDSTVTWYESVIMLIIYAFYILLMKFNTQVHFWISRRLGIEDELTASLGILSQTHDNKCYSSYVPFNNEIDECAQTTITSHPTMAADDVRLVKKRLTFFEAGQMMLMTRYFPPLTRFRAAARRIILQNQAARNAPQKMQPQLSMDGGGGGDVPRWRSKSIISASVVLSTEDEWKRIPSPSEGLAVILKWIIKAPVLAVLYYTIPDCRKSRWKNWFMVSFLMSIVWTAVFSYVMVWMVTLLGYTLGIPDSIMGITFLAAGTSVPDAFASLLVARQGQGDMAVSNSIGSNVFDILVGLAVPWFIYTAMINPGDVATINSSGMVYSVILLFLTIIVTVGGVYFSQWQLTKRLGILLLSVYVVFLIISSMIEFNYFGYVNPPMCKE
ncbi:sodium/potassium/calcium exchanger 4-like [Centruroides vittatus]|uniref:sodium/potassium/calcium exchanger 4-like n=1 Tax=Centruroides vittatus TaxID=120091 RepID=UPI0035106613